MKAPRVIVVVKRSAYRRFVEDEGDPRARQLLRQKDPTVAHWVEAHDEHLRTVETVERSLEKLGARALVLRGSHAAFDANGAALVVAVGGDGTLLAASHNVGAIPILGVNSAPRFSVGFFCAARRKNLSKMLAGALDGSLGKLKLARMAVSLNDRVRSRRVLNEALYCHASPAATSRYVLRHGRKREEQKSSGFWVGPAAGSTGAVNSAGGRVLALGSKKLQVVVREPYVTFGRRYQLLRFTVDPGERVVAHSMMADACMFLDGPYRRIALGLGDVASFTLSDEPLTVLGLSRRRNDGSPRS